MVEDKKVFILKLRKLIIITQYLKAKDIKHKYFLEYLTCLRMRYTKSSVKVI